MNERRKEGRSECMETSQNFLTALNLKIKFPNHSLRKLSTGALNHRHFKDVDWEQTLTPSKQLKISADIFAQVTTILPGISISEMIF